MAFPLGNALEHRLGPEWALQNSLMQVGQELGTQPQVGVAQCQESPSFRHVFAKTTIHDFPKKVVGKLGVATFVGRISYKRLYT